MSLLFPGGFVPRSGIDRLGNVPMSIAENENGAEANGG
jgi:hypothetical protein